MEWWLASLDGFARWQPSIPFTACNLRPSLLSDGFFLFEKLVFSV
jgi:hypothetical protein